MVCQMWAVLEGMAEIEHATNPGTSGAAAKAAEEVVLNWDSLQRRVIEDSFSVAIMGCTLNIPPKWGAS